MKVGDRVKLTADDGKTVEGVVTLCSPGEHSIAVMFEAIFLGHVGMMPLWRPGDSGAYRTIVDTGVEVDVEVLPPTRDQPTETVSINFSITTLDDIHNAVLWLHHLVRLYESIESESNMAMAMRVRLMKNAARIASEGLQEPPPID